jgi:Ferritin-like domain
MWTARCGRQPLTPCARPGGRWAARRGWRLGRGGLDPNDTAILRFDLALEYLQAGLYTEAERLGAVKPRTLTFSRVVGAHERAHAKAIKSFLGSRAIPSPSFDYRGVTEDDAAFVKTAVAFEDLTAALLKWQAPARFPFDRSRRPDAALRTS